MKKNSVKLMVEDPCHEDWDKMSPTEQGRFCNSCQKVVIDFSSLSDTAVLQLLEKNKGVEMCGQFHPQQLERNLHHGYTENSLFSLRSVLLGATITSLLSLESCKSNKNVVGKMYVQETVENNDNVGHQNRHRIM